MRAFHSLFIWIVEAWKKKSHKPEEWLYFFTPGKPFRVELLPVEEGIPSCPWMFLIQALCQMTCGLWGFSGLYGELKGQFKLSIGSEGASVRWVAHLLARKSGFEPSRRNNRSAHELRAWSESLCLHLKPVNNLQTTFHAESNYIEISTIHSMHKGD